MKTSRRDFLMNASMATVFLGAGGLKSLSAQELIKSSEAKVKIRFIVASDAHYGQPNTKFEQMTETFLEKANLFHSQMPCNFCVLNGDLIHDESHLMPQVKSKLDGLEMPYYVTKGNHDKVSDEDWQMVWDMPVNLAFEQDKSAFILATTSDIEGTYLSPDLDWMRQQFEAFKKSKSVFVFIHMPQAKWTENGIENPGFFVLLREYPNVRAVFHGHDHKLDDVKMHNDLPFIFDSHIGGSWGTAYHGFRVVEVLKDGAVLTYMMNPTEAMEKQSI